MNRWPVYQTPAMFEAVHDRSMRGGETLRVYFALALWCDHTKWTYLKVSALAHHLGLARSTLRAAIDDLKVRGYVEEVEYSHKSRAFRLNYARSLPNEIQ